jgi:hypothetical protein
MARHRNPTDIVPLQLRLPELLRKRLAAEAEKAQRSLNSEILYRLGHSLSPEWQGFIANAERKEKENKERLEEFWNDPKVQETLNKVFMEHFGHLIPKEETKK